MMSTKIIRPRLAPVSREKTMAGHCTILFMLAALLLNSLALSAAPKAAGKKPAKTAKTPTATQPWEAIKTPRLPPFHPQEPKRVEFPNGIVVFLQEDHELPLIEGTIRIRGGSRVEPADKVGLVRIYGQAWRTGGTTGKTGDELDDFLEARAAKVETGGGVDSSTLSWSCLKNDFEDVFKVAVDVLRNPEFRPEKIALAKQQLNTAISRRNDDPGAIASREAAKLAYGAESPYARIPEYYTVAAVTRDDLVNWHRQYVHPNNIILGVTGDFDPAAMEARLRQAFGDWPRGPEADRHPQIEISPASPGIYFVQKDDVNQSTVRMVHLGITRDNPDYYAVGVMNEVLGGGFSGRLMSTIRTKLGLAYSVGGGVGAQYDHPGVFQLVMETKSGTTAAAIDALNQQLSDLQENPATPYEIKRAKDTILNSFIFEFDEKDKVLGERMTYEFYGYPADFLERFRVGIENVTSDDVARVARKYVHKEKLATLVLGNSSDFDRQLTAFGPVTKLDISIPENAPGKTAQSNPAQSNPEGKELAQKVAAAVGDAAKIKSVHAVKQTLASLRNTPQGEISVNVEQTVVYPDHVFVDMQTPMGEFTTVITPAAAVMNAAGRSQALPASVRDENLKGIKRDLIYIAQHVSDPKFTFTAKGGEKIGDVETKVVEVNADGAELRWFVDPASGHVLRVAYHSTSMQGPLDRVVDFSDWRETDGISLPFKRAISDNNEATSQDTLKSIEINPPVDAKVFAGAEGSAAGQSQDNPR